MKKEEKNEFRKKDRTKFSLAGQVLIFSLLAAILTGVLSYILLRNSADKRVQETKEELADQLTEDIVGTIKGYPAYEWLLTYWLQNSASLDVEYKLTDNTIQKAKEFSKRHPGLVLDYVTTEEVLALPAEDQKLYAEVIYNQILSLMNMMKETYKPSYLSVLVMNTDYTHGTFLLSGASSDQKRGSNYEDAYIIGVEADSTQGQRESMITAEKGGRVLVTSGDYVDSFGYIQDILDGQHVVVGVTYDITEVRKEVEKQVFNVMVLFVLLQGILAVGLFILIYAAAVRPIERIQKNVWKYRELKESEPVLKDLATINVKNELGALSGDISDMIVSIDQYVDEIQTITAENERIEAELNVATRIQAEMLPSDFPAFPDRKDFDLYATMDPAKEVGGDFYDFFMLDEDHLVLVIADVSGKGVPAALFMVNSKTRIQNQAGFGKTPSEVLSAVNDQLCVGNESGFFVTVWMAIIDLKTGKGVAANAGHEHPVIRRADGSYEASIYKHSPAVGVMEGVPFREHEFELHPGDRIFVYTDGVPEATSSAEELFGMDRLIESLNSHEKDSLEELLPHVKEDIDAFVGDAVQFDDITMLGFDYYGPDGKQ